MVKKQSNEISIRLGQGRHRLVYGRPTVRSSRISLSRQFQPRFRASMLCVHFFRVPHTDMILGPPGAFRPRVLGPTRSSDSNAS
jgi:hypothetical protein